MPQKEACFLETAEWVGMLSLLLARQRVGWRDLSRVLPPVKDGLRNEEGAEQWGKQ